MINCGSIFELKSNSFINTTDVGDEKKNTRKEKIKGD